MFHNSKRALACLRHVAATLGLLCFSANASAITVSPSPSYDGTYTVSWPTWGATGCTYTYNEPFLTFSCYFLEELLPGASAWTGVPIPDYSTSWVATGKSVGTYQYRLQYAYGDIFSGNQYVIDGPVSVQVWDTQPPLPPEQVPPDLENPPFRCNVINSEYYTGYPVDASVSAWYFDTFSWTVIPIAPPIILRHSTDDTACLMIGLAPDTFIPRPMELGVAFGPPVPIPGLGGLAVEYFLTVHGIDRLAVAWSYCSWFFPAPCEVLGAVLPVGIDLVNLKWIGRWAVHSALIFPLY
jgi:hypothetical protein